MMASEPNNARIARARARLAANLGELQQRLTHARKLVSPRTYLANPWLKVGLGVAVYVLSSATFPYWPDTVAHPLCDVTFRLLGENLVAPSLGSVVGVTGIAGIAPVLAIGFGAPGVAIWRIAGARGLAIAVAVSAALLAAYGTVPHGEPRSGAAYRSVRAAVLDL